MLGHIEEKNESKYLVFDSKDEKKDTQNFWMGLEMRLKE